MDNALRNISGILTERETRKIRMGPDKEMLKALQEAMQGLDDKDEPKSADPKEWRKFMENGGFEGERFKAFKRVVRDSIKDPRPGSVGEYLKKYLTEHP